MTNRILFCLSFVTLMLAVMAPLRAQVALFDADQLESACLDFLCDESVDRIVTEFQENSLDRPTINSQLGLIAAILLDASRAQPTRTSKHIAAAILALADYSSDPAQASAVKNAGMLLARGEANLLTTSEPFAVSPDRPGFRGIRGRSLDARKRREKRDRVFRFGRIF